MANVLVLTVGLPRAGKSTWAKSQGVPVVNPDSIRLALTGKTFYAPAEGMVWAVAEIMVRSLFLGAHDCVILDATNITRERRAKWAKFAHSCGGVVAYKVFGTPVAECQSRDFDQGGALRDVIERMANQWEELDAVERALEMCDNVADMLKRRKLGEQAAKAMRAKQ